MFLKTNLGYLSQIALENMQLLIQNVNRFWGKLIQMQHEEIFHLISSRFF